MARAPETGFYFEPLAERLALVLEGAPFPSDGEWAYVGDPVDMAPELARLEVATRWPGVDPAALEVEFDLDFARAAAEMEDRKGDRESGEIEIDLDSLLQQAGSLKATAERPQAPGAREAEAETEEQTVGGAIARAHATSRDS